MLRSQYLTQRHRCFSADLREEEHLPCQYPGYTRFTTKVLRADAISQASSKMPEQKFRQVLGELLGDEPIRQYVAALEVAI